MATVVKTQNLTLISLAPCTSIWSGVRRTLRKFSERIRALLPTKTQGDPQVFHVVHPLDDVPEQKRDVKSLGPMKMTPGVKFGLFVCRGYLICMMGLVFYHVLGLAGVI